MGRQMIYYIASYPRSGNAMLRSLISRHWRYLVTPDGMLEWDRFVTDYAKFSVQRSDRGRHLIQYTVPKTDEIRHMIAPDYSLSLIQRRALAATKTNYFIKTHEWPQTYYVDGEKLIQIIRHPGDALLSYAQLSKDYRQESIDLGALISGKIGYGSWAGYHDAWAEAKLPKLFLKFESVRENPAEAVAEIAEFIGKPVPASITIETFEQASKRNPMRNPKSRRDEWRNLPDEMLQMMEMELGKTASRFGYEIR